MLEKFENLNINDLDVQELENRLEMTIMETEVAGWVEKVGQAPPITTGCPPPGIPGQPQQPLPPGCP